MSSALFACWTLLRALGAVVYGIWWLAGGETHPLRFWAVLVAAVVLPVALLPLYRARLAASAFGRRWRDAREAQRRAGQP